MIAYDIALKQLLFNPSFHEVGSMKEHAIQFIYKGSVNGFHTLMCLYLRP